MVSGSRCGDRRLGLRDRVRLRERGDVEALSRPLLGVETFVREEGGYTSVAVAVSLLVCLSLVMSLAMVSWRHNRAADVQSVADAAALSGANVVSAYATVATTVDACVLTLGLAGMVTLGAGLVVSAVPGLSAAGASTVEAGMNLLDSRREFATSAAKGLKEIENTLPLAIAARSYGVVEANDAEHADYTGCAVPFPQQSETDFSALETDVDAEGLREIAERLQEASDKAEAARAEADAAMREGWLADCADEPRNLRERAATLAGLSGASNPSYASPETWTFGAPLLRARAYYAQRLAAEAPLGSSAEELTDSAARKAFYAYALAEVRAGRYAEHADGSVEVSLPQLPATTEQMRRTRMYTDVSWPCTSEPAGRTLHASRLCPQAVGAPSGMASLKQLDDGAVVRCDACRMSSSALGNVAAASTSIDNGFEHYWRRIVEASGRYKQAAGELAAAERELKGTADEGASLFDEVLDALAVPRPKLCPPGAWGCVGVVGRVQTQTPEELSRAFIASGSLPEGVAASAAVLAPDNNTENNDAIAQLFHALSEKMGGGVAGVLGGVGELWGRLLVGYGAAADGLSQAADEALQGLEGVPLGSAASWLRSKIVDVVKAAGFEPVDVRQRKPVLTHTQNVLSRAGAGTVASARELVGRLPAEGDAASLAQALGQQVANELGGTTFTVAEVPIPGTGVRVPITINVGDLLGGAFS